SPLAFARLVRVNLMQRRRIDLLLQPDPILVSNPDQLMLLWA
ncbi:IS4 family transposase, partial [Inquilinus sp. 2KB_12]